MAVTTSNISEPPLGGIVTLFTVADFILKIDDTISFQGFSGLYKVVGVAAQTPQEGEYDVQRLSGNSSNVIPAGTTVLTYLESLQHVTKGYVATTYLNFQEASYQSIVLTGNAVFEAQHHAPARSIAVRLINNNSVAKTLTFPASWTFLGARPSSLAGSKTGVLSLTCFSGSIGDNVFASDLDIVAVWATS